MAEYIAKRAGSQCWLSDIDCFETYKADLKEMSQLSGSITLDYVKKVGNSSFKLYSQDAKLKNLTLTFYVGGTSEEDAMINVSNLISKATDCVIKTEDSTFEYPAVLLSFNDVDTDVDFYHEVTLKFAALKRQALKTSNRKTSGNINNTGNVESGMCIAVTFTEQKDVVNVCGYTLKNVLANIPFIIDGINGEITQDGKNRVIDTDLTRFPKMEPGANYISLPSDCSATITWYPTFM